MSETRQRWRLVFARGEEARYLSHLDAVTQWERALRRGNVPVATTEGFNQRPRIIFAAPLQLGMLAEHELADLYLSERVTAPDLRARLAAGVPAGYRILEVHDVWTGAPAIAPQLEAADYRMTLFGAEPAKLASAAALLMAATELKRIRQRERRSVAYDLRPLILELRAGDANDGVEHVLRTENISEEESTIWMRLRHTQDRGSGRPDEVVAALAGELGLAVDAAPDDGLGDAVSGRVEPDGAAQPVDRRSIEIALPVRERLWLAEELVGGSLPGRAVAGSAFGPDAEAASGEE